MTFRVGHLSWDSVTVCGRYAAAKDPSALAEEFEVADASVEVLQPDFNVAPTKKVYLVVQHDDRRALEVARWGLVPRWAKDPSIGTRMINARAETVVGKPAFRQAFAKRRCIVPADGYFEWYTPTDGPTSRTGKPVKTPFYIHPSDGSSLAMAGLYEWWRDPNAPDGDPSGWRLTCTVITTEASDQLRRIHDRMPLMIAQSAWSRWLDPHASADEASRLLSVPSDVTLDAYAVDVAVNNVRNNGPDLIRPAS